MTDFTLFADYGGTFSDIKVRETILQITSLSEIARREGLLALEHHFDSMPNRFLRELLQMVVDGTDPVRVKSFGKICAATLYRNYADYLDIIALLLVKSLKPEQISAYIDAYDLPDNGALISEICEDLRTKDDKSFSKNYGLFHNLRTIENESERALLFQVLKQSCLRRQKQIADISRRGAYAIQMGDNPSVVLHSLQAFSTEMAEVD